MRIKAVFHIAISLFLFVSVASAETFTGTLVETIADNNDGSLVESYDLQLENGTLYQLLGVDEAASTIPQGSLVSVEGELNGYQISATKISALSFTSTRSIQAVTGAKTSIVIILNFTDEDAMCTPEQLTDLMYTGEKTVSGHFEASSFGQVSFPGNSSNVVGPFSVSANTNSCDQYTWAALGDAAAEAAGVNLSNYEHRIYVVPSSSCSWGGLANTGCTGSGLCRLWINGWCRTGQTFIHELGHNLGLGHAATDENNDGTIEYEYGDYSCPMSVSSRWQHFSAPKKTQMGWITSDKVLTTSDLGSYTLSSQDVDPSLAASYQTIRISRPNGEYYYLSLRNNQGGLYDNVSSSYDKKINIHSHLDGNGVVSSYITALAEGESVELTDIGLTIYHLSNSETESEIVLTGDNSDPDGDGIGNYQEGIDGTNPNDPGSFLSSLNSPVYALWNGFLQMYNIVELINTDSAAKDVTLSLYSINGDLEYSNSYTISANSQFDVILNNLPGFTADSYGLVVLEFTGDLDGRTSYYRTLDGWNSYEFSYSVPFENPLTGSTSVGFNTNQPSTNAAEASYQVYNWLTITNLADSEKTFTINTYDMVGTLLETREVNVPALGRADLDGGHGLAGAGVVGLHQIVPTDSSAQYIAQLMRYGSNATPGVAPSAYNFAFPLSAKRANGQTQYMPISREFGEQTWVEISNSLATSTSITANFYDEDGTLEASDSYTLAPRQQIHLEGSAYLSSGEVGTVTVVPTEINSIVAQSMFYFRSSTGSIEAMYGTQATEALTTSLTGSYNLYLEAENYLRLMNTSASVVTVTVAVTTTTGVVEQAIALGPNSATSLEIHDSSLFGTAPNTYNFLSVTPSAAGVGAELVRLKRNSGSDSIDFAFPTLVRPE